MGLKSTLIVYARRALSAAYSLRLRRYPELAYILQRYSDSESAAVDMADAIALYEAVKSREPVCALDLGPGTSTEIIAAAMPSHGKVVAVEESEKWLAFHKSRLSSDLSASIEYIHSPAVADNGTARYSSIPLLPYDFVHIDGPDYVGLGCTNADDILSIVHNLARSCLIVFDGRQESAKLARPQLEWMGFRMRWNPYTLNREFARD